MRQNPGTPEEEDRAESRAGAPDSEGESRWPQEEQVLRSYVEKGKRQEGAPGFRQYDQGLGGRRGAESWNKTVIGQIFITC